MLSMHIPVMLPEVLSYFSIQEDKVYIDATFGGGAFSAAILSMTHNTRVIAIDRDDVVKTTADELINQYGDRFCFLHTTFAEGLNEIYHKITNNIEAKCDGVFFDYGLSNMQLRDVNRGFSFSASGPLLMNMGCVQTTAHYIINKSSEIELRRIICEYGEEKGYKAIAAAIVQYRQKTSIQNTTQLRKIVEKVVRGKYLVKTLARVFQGFRIAVNDELQQIHDALEIVPLIMKDNGILVTITFHSLEDRIAKHFMKKEQEAGRVAILTKKPIIASQDEIIVNPNARSAKLRACRFITTINV